MLVYDLHSKEYIDPDHQSSETIDRVFRVPVKCLRVVINEGMNNRYTIQVDLDMTDDPVGEMDGAVPLLEFIGLFKDAKRPEFIHVDGYFTPFDYVESFAIMPWPEDMSGNKVYLAITPTDKIIRIKIPGLEG